MNKEALKPPMRGKRMFKLMKSQWRIGVKLLFPVMKKKLLDGVGLRNLLLLPKEDGLLLLTMINLEEKRQGGIG